MRRRIPIAIASLIIGAPVLAMTCAPNALVRTLERAFPGCSYMMSTPGGGRSAIALTIDDAPDPATTPAILDTLRAHGARATFFVITSQLRTTEGAGDSIVERMVREGHELGNHHTRDRPAIRLDSAAFDADLATADSVLRRYAPIRWARPGSGWYSQRMTRAMRRSGHQCALGSVYPLDAGLGWPWLSERYILAHARSGSIIILHDRGRRGTRTAKVLGRLLPVLRARGYEVVTLTELAAPMAPSGGIGASQPGGA